MSPEEILEAGELLIARKAIRHEDLDMLRRASCAIEASEHNPELAADVGVFASFYYQGNNRQLSKAMYTTLLTWQDRLVLFWKPPESR